MQIGIAEIGAESSTQDGVVTGSGKDGPSSVCWLLLLLLLLLCTEPFV